MHQPYSNWKIAMVLALLLIITQGPALAEPASELSTPKPASVTEPSPASGLPPGIVAKEICADKPAGSTCWMELENQPGCYFWYAFTGKWNTFRDGNITATWSGACTSGLAEGAGEIMWVWGTNQEKSFASIGRLQQGKMQDRWVESYSDGHTVAEGPYVDGKRHGTWVIDAGSGTVVEEGSYVNGERHGRWVLRDFDGAVEEGPYVDGQKHGHWVFREPYGSVAGVVEGPYVDGQKHGHWVERRADGYELEGSYVDNQEHGYWVIRTPDGTVHEGPYVDGQKHGHWIIRALDGTVYEESYVDGRKNGQ